MIGATPDEVGVGWTCDLLDSLTGSPYDVIVHQTWDFELSTINYVVTEPELAEVEEFIFLPQSTVVKDLDLLRICFEEHAGYSVNLANAQGFHFRMYLGKYLRDSVLELGVPEVRSKWDAVHQELTWGSAYFAQEFHADRLVDVGGNLEHTDVFEQRHGRLNMVVENEYLRRYKGTWDVAMIRERA